MNRISELAGGPVDLTRPVCLAEGDHAVYWVGSEEPSPFRCNAYLVVDGDHRVLIDPGSTDHHFPQVKRRVEQVVPPSSITHIVVHHQDPDLCDSLPAWIETAPDVTIVTTPRTRVLLPYYGFPPDVNWLDVSPEDSTTLDMANGSLVFITSPFLHFPEALTTFDEATGILFSSDIGAAIEQDWKLVVDDWDRHWQTMIPFHIFYMASNRALKGYLKKIEPFPITALCPQHGSIIPEAHVKRALEALAELPCGLDLLYPASNIESVLAEIL